MVPPTAGRGLPPPGSLLEPPPPVPPVRSTAPPRSRGAIEPSADGIDPSGPDLLRLSERILLHLERYEGANPQELASFQLCQQGMVERLSVRQGALAKVLHRLTLAGAVAASREHVQGVSQRRKVYRLTTLGRLLARDLRARAKRPFGPARSP